MSGLTLHDYQRVGVGHLRRNPQAGLFMDMGLGKTATTLSALTDDHLPVLVVAPKRVAENVWHKEARRWRPDLRVVVAKGRPDDRRRALAKAAAGTADVVVLGRDNLADVERLWRRRTHPFATVVLDELSGFKSGSLRNGSARWKAARQLVLGKACRHVWGLTGTPAPNGLHDLWGQIALLDRGERLGKTLTAFREEYFSPRKPLPNGVVPGYDPLPGADEVIWGLIDDICLSMETDGRIDLPPVTQNVVDVVLPPRVMTAYRRLKRDNLAIVDDLYGREAVTTAGTAAAVSNRLSQMSAGFMYPDAEDVDAGRATRDDFTVLHREKVQAVEEIVEGTGSPVLLFYRYRAELAMLREALGAQLHTVKEPDIMDRWDAGDIPVLAAHPASVGHGLNFQYGGHTVVWTTPDWDLELWDQGNKRVARQGQQHPVVIHVVAGADTIDHAIMDVLNRKASVQGALLAHLESPV